MKNSGCRLLRHLATAACAEFNANEERIIRSYERLLEENSIVLLCQYNCMKSAPLQRLRNSCRKDFSMQSQLLKTRLLRHVLQRSGGDQVAAYVAVGPMYSIYGNSPIGKLEDLIRRLVESDRFMLLLGGWIEGEFMSNQGLLEAAVEIRSYEHVRSKIFSFLTAPILRTSLLLQQPMQNLIYTALEPRPQS